MPNSKTNRSSIRSNLLKYFAELLVVVFGVYLGFKANNYASQVNQQAYVDTTIKEMYHSLEQDIKDAELNKNGHESGLNAVKYFVKIVQSKSVNLDSFDYNFHYLSRNFVSVQNTSPFETIREKGYNVITNDSLRRNMIKLYDFQYEILEKIEEKYQPSQLYANESNHINEILDGSLSYNDNLKLEKIIMPLNITKEEKNRLIIILKSIYNTRLFNISVYDEVIGDMKSLRANIAEIYPYVLQK